MSLLGRLAKQSGIYAIGNAAAKAAGLALAPLLLNPAILSIESFGYFALLMVTAQLGIYVVGLGLSSGLVKHLSDGACGPDRDALEFTALAASIGAAALAVVAMSAAARPLAGLLLDDEASGRLVRWLAVYMAFKVVGTVPLTVLRIRERAGVYVAATAAELAALVGIAWYALAVKGWGLDGLMAAYAVSAAIAASTLTVALLSGIRLRFDPAAIRPLLAYGVPLVLASLAGWFLNAGDRYLLKWLSDPRAVAGYDWAARIAGLVNVLFVQSFQLAFTVLGMKAAQVGDHRFHVRSMRHYVVWTGAAVLALSLFTDDAMRLLVARFGVDPFYGGAGRLVFPLSLGFMAFGLYVIVSNVLLAAGSTRLVGLAVLFAALLNGSLNLVLIPPLGPYGAALATVVAYAALAAVTARAAERITPVGYDWRLPLAVVGALVVLVAASRMGAGLSTPWRLGFHVLLCALYGGFLTGTRLYPAREIRMALRDLAGRF